MTVKGLMFEKVSQLLRYDSNIYFFRPLTHIYI